MDGFLLPPFENTSFSRKGGEKMKFTKYNGHEKYHFRLYRKTRNHPFLVILVTEEKVENGKFLITGFNLTHSTLKVLQRPSKFIKLARNPNPEDDTDSFLCIELVKDKEHKFFSSPLKKWSLSKEDEEKIDKILSEKYLEFFED